MVTGVMVIMGAPVEIVVHKSVMSWLGSGPLLPENSSKQWKQRKQGVGGWGGGASWIWLPVDECGHVHECLRVHMCSCPCVSND